MRKKLFFFTLLFLIAFLTVTKSKAQDSIYKSTNLVQPPLFSGYNGFRVWSFGINAGMMAPFSAAGGKNDFSKWVPTLGYGAY